MERLQKIGRFLGLLAFLFFPATAFAEDLPTENGKELLVLRNGQILEGRVAKLKGRYAVDLPDGEIQIRATEVEFVCRNLKEGYDRKRAVIQAGDWREHLELARWCQKQEMSDLATIELTAAAAISPENPMIDAFRRQIEKTVEKPPAKPEKTPPPEDAVSNEELDRMARSLPPRAVELFTQSVQPMLMNNCTATGCHGPQSSTNFRLFRVATNQSVNRRLTQRNLYAVLQYVNSDNPSQSPLLTMPSGPHGTAKNAVFTEQRAGQYHRMADWLMGLRANDQSSLEALVHSEPSKKETVDSPADVSSAPRLLSHEAQKAKPLAAAKKSREQPKPATDSSNEVMPASYQEPPAEFLQSNLSRDDAANLSSKVVSPSETKPQLLPTPKVKRGAPLPQPESKDPFDPEIFNRRYHRQDGPKEGITPPKNEMPKENTPAPK